MVCEILGINAKVWAIGFQLAFALSLIMILILGIKLKDAKDKLSEQERRK